jgi:hypothetical protein
MYDEQQENGSDDPPAMDVRWEGRLLRLEMQAHSWNERGMDWKILEITAGDLARLIKERRT